MEANALPASEGKDEEVEKEEVHATSHPLPPAAERPPFPPTFSAALPYSISTVLRSASSSSSPSSSWDAAPTDSLSAKANAIITGKDEIFSKPSHEIIFGRFFPRLVPPAADPSSASAVSGASVAATVASTPRRPEFDLESNYDWTEGEDEDAFPEFDVEENDDDDDDDDDDNNNDDGKERGNAREKAESSLSSSSSSRVGKEEADVGSTKRLSDLEILTPQTEKMPPPLALPMKRKRKIASESSDAAVSKIPKYFVHSQVVTFEGLRGNDQEDSEDVREKFEKEDAGVNKLPEYIYSIAYQCLRTLLEPKSSEDREANADVTASSEHFVNETVNQREDISPEPTSVADTIIKTFSPSMADDIDEEDDDDRRVVYVGKIRRNSTTKTKLRKRFERFGSIQKITFHRRRADRPLEDFAFITFHSRQSAVDAIEGGNRHLTAANQDIYDLSFGGRRQFCRREYRDLDEDEDEEASEARGGNTSFEELLRRNLARARKNTF